MSRPHCSLTERLAEYFKARPNEWIDGRELSRVAGTYGWRTRTSELRTQRGLTIENRQRHVKTPDGQYTISEYRFVPREATKQPDLFSESEKNCLQNQL